ncbi:MAG: hypothetical protein EOP88_12670 [Verrucomicrobiaceae bacterium]|nr:MAG: hypothetical protein EOP88_12670 [Verrucomicrobiaceae bacterium]
MAEVIQFHCPACGMTLRLPLAMAAQQGPCPNCDREIVAPDPYHGIGAFLAPVLPPPPVPEPFTLFVETPPLVPRHEEHETMRHPVYQQPEPLPAPPPVQFPAYQPEPFPPYQAEPPFPLPEPLHPFSEPAPVAQEPFSLPPVEPEPDPPAPAAVAESSACLVETERSRSRLILLFACLVTGLVALVFGILLGALGTRFFAPIPPYKPTNFGPPSQPEQPAAPEVPAPTPTPAATPEQPAPPSPEPPKPEPPATPAPEASNPEPTPEPEPPPAVPAKVSAGAEAALKAFLEAPDWAARSAHVLAPDKVKAAMEAYSREVPDGPTAYRTITVKQSEVDESTRSTIFIFMVTTERHQQGIPVAVKETPGGWLVDWLAFVEFRDDLFQKFTDGPVDKTGFFHLIVTRPPEKRAEETENEHFSSFVLQSPVSGKGQLAFIRKGTSAYETVHAATEGGTAFTPVLEVRKSKTAEGQSYFEVMAVKANDWFPREN